MKTAKLSLLTLVTACGLGASALADDQSPTMNNQRREVRREAVSNRAADNQKQQTLLVRTVEYPFVFLGRTGRTFWHTPTIVSETFHGQRSIISKQGFMARRQELGTPGQRVASAPAQSIVNTRG